MKDLASLQCEFSVAYVRAVAAAAGFYLQEATRAFDMDGVDVTMMARGRRGIIQSPRLDIQIKSKGGLVDNDPWPYDLDVKTYDLLRAENLQLPRILIVVCVPREPAEWLSHTTEQLVLRRCGYWRSLRGEAASANKTKIRVELPLAQVFDPAQASSIMERVASGGLP